MRRKIENVTLPVATLSNSTDSAEKNSHVLLSFIFMVWCLTQRLPIIMFARWILQTTTRDWPLQGHLKANSCSFHMFLISELDPGPETCLWKDVSHFHGSIRPKIEVTCEGQPMCTEYREYCCTYKKHPMYKHLFWDWHLFVNEDNLVPICNNVPHIVCGVQTYLKARIEKIFQGKCYFESLQPN